MNAREIVAALEALGVRLRAHAVENTIDLEAESEPPRELLDELARNKAGVLSFLRAREAPPAPAEKPPPARTFGGGRPEDDFGPRSAWGTF